MRRQFQEITFQSSIKMKIQTVVFFSCLTLCLAGEGCSFTSSSVSCEQQSGRFLPMETNSEISSLYIIRSDLSALTEEDFIPFFEVDTVSIINSTLRLPNNDRLLSMMSDLSVLRIVHCNVSEGVSAVFADNARISQLHLSNNKISSLKTNFFAPIKYVELIDLSHNKIRSIAVGTFDGLVSLRVVNLTKNYIGRSFDTNFLSLQSAICVVCMERIGINKCTSNDFNRCKKNEQEDHLWWISTQVAIQLKENPICGTFSRSAPSEAEFRRFMEFYPPDQHLCQVYEHGHCFKHERRRMFFLEACDIANVPPWRFVDRKACFPAVTANDTILCNSNALLIIVLLLAQISFVKLIYTSQGDNPKSSNSSSVENDCSIPMEENGGRVQESLEDDNLMEETESNTPPFPRQT